MNHDGFNLLIGIIRVLNVCVGAALAALMLRASLPVWNRLGTAERWLTVTLFIYSANVTLFTALVLDQSTSVGPNSYIHIGFLASFVAGHRYLYFVRRDRTHVR